MREGTTFRRDLKLETVISLTRAAVTDNNGKEYSLNISLKLYILFLEETPWDPLSGNCTAAPRLGGLLLVNNKEPCLRPLTGTFFPATPL